MINSLANILTNWGW